MASIRSRKDSGKLFFDFRVAGQRFREQTELDDTTANRKKAEAVAARLEYEVQAGTLDYGRFFPNSPNRARYEALIAGHGVRASSQVAHSNVAVAIPLFHDFVETWFAENEVRWRRTTRELMRMIVDKQLMPVFGTRPVGSITRADVLAFRAEFAKRPGKQKSEPISPKTVNDTVGVLKSILDEAAARHGFPSPCQALKRLKVPKTDVLPFTLDETRQLPEHAVLCQTPHAGGGMSAFFEWRDVGKGRAWRRSLEEGRLDLIGTKSAKQFKTKRSLPRLSHDPCEVGVAAGCCEAASLHPCTCILYKYMYSHAP